MHKTITNTLVIAPHIISFQENTQKIFKRTVTVFLVCFMQIAANCIFTHKRISKHGIIYVIGKSVFHVSIVEQQQQQKDLLEIDSHLQWLNVTKYIY